MFSDKNIDMLIPEISGWLVFKTTFFLDYVYKDESMERKDFWSISTSIKISIY
jgi:hypothetical protein